MADWIRSSNQLTAVWPIQVVATENESRVVGGFALNTPILLSVQSAMMGYLWNSLMASSADIADV